MISFIVDGHKFQLRAAAVIVHDGSVLLHRTEFDPFWALPGGRVEPGEDAATTVTREMQEETGQDVVCERLLHVAENFFDYQGQRHHELGLYFLAHFRPDSPLLAKDRVHIGIEGNQRLEFAWFSLTELHQVDLKPSFLITALTQPGLPFGHFRQRE
ncbi:MAG: NUDIX domain-containing protein [Burkholderiaceae bacterium]|nr:NUDIX domain-containing protein [Burkholderiaceae bacterium]